MTRLALIALADKTVVREVAAGGWIELPDGGRVSPAVAGWQGGGEIAYAKVDGHEQAVEGPPRYAVVEVDAFAAPAGKVAAGPSRLTFDAETGKVSESRDVADPPVVATTPADKVAVMLAAFDLTLAELRDVLGDSEAATRV